MDYDLQECKMTALASFSFKSHVPKRFLTFLQTPACDQILVRAIEFARVFLRRTQATKSTSGSPSRTIAREQDAVTRLLSQEYVGLVRSESWSGPSNQRANHADAKFFEALFQLMDATLVRVLKGTSPACMQLVHIEINRVLRSPTFNAARHTSEKRGASRLWCELPTRRPVCESKRVKNKKLPEDDRALGIVRAVKQKSPLVAVKCPSVGDKYKKYTDLTSKLRRDPGHSPNGIPGVPNRCVPTTQLCIIAKCPYCSVPRLAATQKFRMTQRVAQETKWFTQEPHTVFAPVLLEKLRSLKFDAYKLRHEKTIDMAVTMMEVSCCASDQIELNGLSGLLFAGFELVGAFQCHQRHFHLVFDRCCSAARSVLLHELEPFRELWSTSLLPAHYWYYLLSAACEHYS